MQGCFKYFSTLAWLILIVVAFYVHVKYCYLINQSDKRFHISQTKLKRDYTFSVQHITAMTFNNLMINTITATLIKTAKKLQINIIFKAAIQIEMDIHVLKLVLENELVMKNRTPYVTCEVDNTLMTQITIRSFSKHPFWKMLNLKVACKKSYTYF